MADRAELASLETALIAQPCGGAQGTRPTLVEGQGSCGLHVESGGWKLSACTERASVLLPGDAGPRSRLHACRKPFLNPGSAQGSRSARRLRITRRTCSAKYRTSTS